MSERLKITYTTRAKEDIRNIYCYIAYQLKEKRTAKRMIECIRKKIHDLGFLPERFQSVTQEPWASMGMRQLMVGNYIVCYLADIPLKQITIFRISYGGRNIETVIGGE